MEVRESIVDIIVTIDSQEIDVQFACGATPYISNGNWFIGGVDTGVKADYAPEQAVYQQNEENREANEAIRQSNEQVRQQQEQKRQTDTATAIKDTESAIIKTNEATAGAIDAKNKALASVDLANSTIVDMNNKIAEADTAIIATNIASDNANTQATYAKTQGDYAKTQGDTVDAKIDAKMTEFNATLYDDKGLIRQELVNPMQGLQKYFTTPAKNNNIGYTGKLTPILKNDFMIELIVNMEYAQSSGDSIFAIERDKGLYAKGSLFVYGLLGNNNLDWVLFRGSEDKPNATTNSIGCRKTLPPNKLFHVVIGRTGVNAWGLVNGVFYRKTQSEVLEISNLLTIANAKKFAQLRKFNFCDESYAQKLWNGGRWWEVSVEREMYNNGNRYAYMSPMVLSEFSKIYNKGEMTLVDGALCFLVDNKPMDAYRGIYKYLSTENVFKKNAQIKLKCKIKRAIQKDTAMIMGMGATGTALYVQRNILLTTDDWVTVEILCVNKYHLSLRAIYFYSNYLEEMHDGFGFYVKDIEVTECALQDEFLPQSFNSTCAINTAGGENLAAMEAENITFSYDDYASEVLVGSELSTVPDMVGQKLLTVPLDVRERGDIYMCSAPVVGEELTAKLWTKVNV